MHIQDSVELRFAEFTKLYVGDFQQDIPLYLELAAKQSGPVLDAGCRTGRVAAYLAAAGHEVQGIDSSAQMLKVAVEHLKPWASRARVGCFDLRQHPLPTRFPVVLVPLHGFNRLIDIEEQRLFLRHLRRSMASPGVVAIDLFCPLSLVRPELADQWREIRRSYDGQSLVVRDRREMLTPLLERRVQAVRMNGGPEQEMVTHRRYVPPMLVVQLLEEAGFEAVRCLRNYDLGSSFSAQDGLAEPGPFVVLAEA